MQHAVILMVWTWRARFAHLHLSSPPPTAPTIHKCMPMLQSVAGKELATKKRSVVSSNKTLCKEDLHYAIGDNANLA